MLVRKIVKTEVEVAGLGAAIKAAQVASGKSIESVVREVGISRTYWHGLLKETTDGVSYDLLKKLEKALAWESGVEIDC
jgi:hypothetical protein